MRVLLILLLFTSCTFTGETLGKFNFGYSVENKELNNIIQVFDDGAKTYIHFFKLPKTDPLLSVKESSDSKYVRKYYRIKNSFIELTGIYTEIKINNGGRISKILRDEIRVNDEARS